MQAPPIDFQCSLTILAALRAVCVCAVGFGNDAAIVFSAPEDDLQSQRDDRSVSQI